MVFSCCLGIPYDFDSDSLFQVDLEMLDRLLARFRELDVMQEGALDIGIDVPSASQVQSLFRAVSYIAFL